MWPEFFKSRGRMQAVKEGTAGSLLEGFTHALSEAGYSAITARKHLRAAKHFVDWGQRQGIPVRKLNEQLLTRFERYLSRRHSRHPIHADQRKLHGTRLLLSYLRDARITGRRSIPRAVPTLLSAFGQWMRQQRGTVM